MGRGRWLGVALLGVGLACAALYSWRHTPERSLQLFYVYGNDPSSGVAEDMLMDPLILAGKPVVPLVLEQVKSAHMPKRRYAIGFLGNGGYVEALPALRAIVGDEREEALFRGDALDAICGIDNREGTRLAASFTARPDYLGDTARQIAQHGCDAERRTYAQALAGLHD